MVHSCVVFGCSTRRKTGVETKLSQTFSMESEQKISSKREKRKKDCEADINRKKKKSIKHSQETQEASIKLSNGTDSQVGPKKDKKKRRNGTDISKVDLEENNGEKKKSAKHKQEMQEDSTQLPNGTANQINSKKEKKSKEKRQNGESLQDQLLVSDISKVVGEIFDEMRKEFNENGGKKKRMKNNKKKKENSQETEGTVSNHKVFNDDDDLVSNAPHKQGEEKVKKKKKSKQVKEETQAFIDSNHDSCPTTGNLAESEQNKNCGKDGVDTTVTEHEELHRKEKNKKKSKERESELENNYESSDKPVVSPSGCEIEKKKKKNKSHDDIDTSLKSESEKKKKRKNKISDDGESDLSNNHTQNDLETVANASACSDSGRKKKKKSKNKSETDISLVDCVEVKNENESDSGEDKKSKKSKKRKSEDAEIESGSCEHETPVKKKKKATVKDNLFDSVNVNTGKESDDSNCLQSESKRNKKRKSGAAEIESCESETPVKKKKKDRDTSLKTPFQEAINSPVFESEERRDKFSRLLGAKKNKDIPDTHVNTTTDNANNSQSSDVSGAGQWKGTMFESAERQNKFIRLLGGAKSSAEKKTGLFSSSNRNATPKKGLFGSLMSKMSTNGVDSNAGGGKALNLDAAANLNQSLEDDYNRALSRRLGGSSSTGIGFVKDPAEGKTFHINTSAVKSTKFSDDE